MYSVFHAPPRGTSLLLLGTSLLLASAGNSETRDATHSHSDLHELEPFVVDAALGPRNSRDMLTPATVLAGDGLELSRAATIGQVLDGQAGVHSTAFGAGASRPVIRGLEGVRLRVMESGVDSGDLSAESPDHAVAIEPFFIERIEVLRGASTLLYGSSAIGGVVNAIDKRIPREYPVAGGTLEAMTDFQSAADGWTFATLATIPLKEVVLSVSYLDRDYGNYSIPGHPDHDETHDGEEPSGILENSFVESRVGSAALSWFASDNTRFSLAWTSSDSLYGVPGHAHEGEHEGEEEHHEDESDHHEEEAHGHEEGVSIDLSQTVVDLEFEHRIPVSWFQTIEGRIRHVRYAHQELEGEEIGTDFDRESLEARLLATYLSGDALSGAIGAQWALLDSKAVGEESLTPDSETTDAALFLLQEWQMQNLRVEGGARAEHREIDALGHAGYSDWAFSASLGAKLPLNENWSAGLLVNHADRHPVATELYALGPHAATRQFEIGNPALGRESANGIDFSIHHHSAIWSGSLTAFHTAFSDFIFASPTAEEEDGFRVYRYTQVDADFQGFEAELTWHAWHEARTYFDLGFLMDWVDTDIKGSPEHLPRIPPFRAGAHVQFGSDRWMVRSSVRHSFEQNDTAPFEEASAAYTDVAASLLLDLPVPGGDWHLLVSGENLLDEEIRPHTSPIKDLAPSPGRHLRVNLSIAF